MTVVRVVTLSAVLLACGCGDRFDAGDCKVSRTCAAGGGTSTAGTAAGGSGTGAGGSEGAGTSGVGGTSGGGSGGSAGEGGTGACEGDVSDDAACWTSNEYGVFVSNEHGDDATGTGTKEFPYKSITKGVAAAGGKKIFVCLGPSGDYTDALTFDSAENVAIYGGFECENWEYSTTRKAGIKPAKNIALRINKSKNLTFENVRITAADATGSGYDASSYGAFETDSQGVVFRRAEISAGKGAKGADGEDGAAGENGDQEGDAPPGFRAVCLPLPTDTEPADIVGGKWLSESSCGSQGGAGGTGVKNTTNAANGGAGAPAVNVTPLDKVENGGAGETTTNMELGGKPGAVGVNGMVGGAAPSMGTFSENGFMTGNGKAGSNGYPGQGGGGGGASRGTSSCYGASGGAGGMGGCGGRAGTGGEGGGASVGIFAWRCELTLEDSKVVSLGGGAGGKGGKGGISGVGATGGDGGAPFSDGENDVLRGGNGGPGGNGGLGGSGAGGIGGPSVAIVYSGAKPVYGEGTELATGASAPGGAGGQRGAAAPNGADGVTETELEVD